MRPADAPTSFQQRFPRENGRHTSASQLCVLSKVAFVVGILLLAVLAVSPHVTAQNAPKVNAVDPATGKVNDSVTLTGENLGKDSVSAVFLSDDKDDYKAALVQQDNGKIVLKVPQVKSGGYNISVQEGDKILILPIRFTVQDKAS